MLPNAFFSNSYDLYRTVVSKASYEQQTSLPDSPTSYDNPCRFFPNPSAATVAQMGLDIDIDAVMYVPSDADLKPDESGENADWVDVGGNKFFVSFVKDPGSLGLYKKVMLNNGA